MDAQGRTLKRNRKSCAWDIGREEKAPKMQAVQTKSSFQARLERDYTSIGPGTGTVISLGKSLFTKQKHVPEWNISEYTTTP